MSVQPGKWCHATSEWKWSDDAGCYIQQPEYMAPPTAYTLGDRYAYAHFGRDSFGVVWRGSTATDWGGYSFGYDLGKAIRWVRRARRRTEHYFVLDGAPR